jgi:hypothetical protein
MDTHEDGAARDAQRNEEMLADAKQLIAILAQNLCVSTEPADTFYVRLREAAIRAGREPWTAGAWAIDRERGRQITSEGYEDAHDDAYIHGELVSAAICYLRPNNFEPGAPMAEWPLRASSWKPGSHKRNLEKAGALIAAEWDRVDRAATRYDKLIAPPVPFTPPLLTSTTDGARRYHTIGRDGVVIDLTDEINALIQRHSKGNT